MSEIKTRVNDITTINFSITKCPHKVYQNFVGFCKEDTNDNYSMGLKMLLEARTSNIKEVILFEQYMELKERVVDLEQEIHDLKKSPKKKESGLPKTFGSAKKEM